jgi:hypothetical protein
MKDEVLNQRVREALGRFDNVVEKRMFGGVCFMLNGNMLCGTHRNRLMFRVGREQEKEALSRSGARRMDITGRPMAGFVFVDPAKCNARQLKGWINLAENYVGALPRRLAHKPPKKQKIHRRLK